MARTKNVETPDTAIEKRIKALWRRKNMSMPFEAFYEWYMKQEQKCCYCGIDEPTIKELVDNGRLSTKRPTRGLRLELERKDPNKSYDDLKNLALCCYWCNNAKTDIFTEEEFRLVGRTFNKIWKNRLQEISNKKT